MFDGSLLYIVLAVACFIFIGSLFFLCISDCWTEIRGYNEPNTYGGRTKKEYNQHKLMILSDSIRKK